MLHSSASPASSRPHAATPRVLLVCPVGNQIGGAEHLMLAIARELPKAGFDPLLAVMRPGKLADLARSQGTEAYTFPVDHRYSHVSTVLRAISWLADLTQRTNASLQHATHTAHLYSYFASRRVNVPDLWHLHDLPSGQDPISIVNGRLYPNHTIFTTLGIAKAYPRLRRNPYTVVAPSCIEPAILRSHEPRPDVRVRFALPCGPLLLNVARLQKHKGHTYLLRAAKEILRHYPTVAVVIVGHAGTTEQENYKKRLLNEAEQLGISQNIHLLGHVDDADLAALYRESSVLVHPAWSEGYGLVLLEAMAMGLPVIAAAATGPTEILRDGENGLLVPVRNAGALAKAIERILNDEVLCTRLKAGGAATAEKLTLDVMVKQVSEVYCKMLSLW